MSDELQALRNQVMQAAGGATRLHLAFVGVVNHLFDALHGLERAEPASLALKAARDVGYVRRWCEAAYAFELLELEGDEYALSPLGDSFRSDVEGSLMPFAVQSVLGAHMAERAAGLMQSGERPGEVVLTERETILPFFGPMLEGHFGGFFEREILPRLDVYREVDERGGVAVDLGCGNGWYVRRLAKRFAKLRGIGLDSFEANVRGAEERAAAEGLGERLRFSVGDLHHFSVEEPVALIAMNRALHHVWDQKDNVFRILHEHLEPGGAAVIWEPAWPADVRALRAPGMRPMAFQNLSEHVQGNHFLRPEEIAEAFASVDLEPSIQLFADGKEAVIVGRKKH